jgi:hypothetical protein
VTSPEHPAATSGFEAFSSHVSPRVRTGSGRRGRQSPFFLWMQRARNYVSGMSHLSTLHAVVDCVRRSIRSSLRPAPPCKFNIRVAIRSMEVAVLSYMSRLLTAPRNPPIRNPALIRAWPMPRPIRGAKAYA